MRAVGAATGTKWLCGAKKSAAGNVRFRGWSCDRNKVVMWPSSAAGRPDSFIELELRQEQSGYVAKSVLEGHHHLSAGWSCDRNKVVMWQNGKLESVATIFMLELRQEQSDYVA
jgi:hypothetical protein